jgi:hypothetical protein
LEEEDEIDPQPAPGPTRQQPAHDQPVSNQLISSLQEEKCVKKM